MAKYIWIHMYIQILLYTERMNISFKIYLNIFKYPNNSAMNIIIFKYPTLQLLLASFQASRWFYIVASSKAFESFTWN